MEILSSLVPVDATLVIRKCDDLIKYHEEIDSVQAQKILKQQLRIRNFWRKLFGLRLLTEKEVDQKLRKSDKWKFSYPPNSGWYYASKARKIARLASRAKGDVVYMSPEDWDDLFIKVEIS